MYSKFWILCVLLINLFISQVTSEETCVESGAVRLVGSVNMTEGRLEICVNGLWGTVCNDGINEGDKFDNKAARVVCRQLGFPESTLPEVITDVFFGGGASFQHIHLDALRCTGAEPNLLNCTHNGIGVHDCEHSEDVGIICARSQDCIDGSVRLVDGDNYNAAEGRVEYCVGGLWGTVCDYQWDTQDAKVICRQLGLITNEPRVLNKGNVPRVSNPLTPIFLDGVNCRGTESSLRDCGSVGYVEYCAHYSPTGSSDAGASCTNITECNDTDVRLIQLAEDMKNEGRVEYCSGGRWGQLCSDFWDSNDAEVVCRQLGYNVEDGNAVAKTSSISSVETPIHILLGKLDCEGAENSVSQCSHDNSYECIRPGAGVICPVQLNVSQCTDRDVRLQGGELSNEIGRVEVCMAGQWGLICHEHWDDVDASIVCRQLGYTGGIATRRSIFGTTLKGHFVLNDVNCTGNESNIFDCQHPTDIHINCQVARNEEAGAVCGVTSDSSTERCTEEHTNKTIMLGSDATNLTAGSIGTCQPYTYFKIKSNLCSSFYTFSDYIFTAMNQTFVSNELSGRILPILSGDDGECSDLISRLLCHYFFAPCGVNGQLHLPLAVCQEECQYVQSACTNQWRIANNLLSSAGLSAVSCSATGSLLQGVAPCCIDAGITIKNITMPTEKENVTLIDSPETGNTLGLVIGLLATFLIVLMGVVIVTICLATVIVRKRKATIRSLQLEVLTSPMRTAVAPLSAHILKTRDDHSDFGADIKMHGNGGPLAIPNPYSSKQELALSLPLPLSPTENKMMNRISSSIIRELSSNMLIPYTRLKLLECVGQGEFGVVYKAQHTESEGDIGYKTSTVAVKTLKGFFDNSQVNKIMEEGVKMKHFDHPNVLHLIGVCLDAGPAPYVVMPYMANGSLLHYLKKERNNLVLPVGVDDDVKIDVRKRLTVMCLQIASGMEYLAGEKFVHRDLAARNCMIDIHFVIKIADFGLSEDVYVKNYFRQSGSDKSIKLPVKWMAPESLSDGVFSEKSDMWSFGVTCWEIFSGGKTPYPGVDPVLLSQVLEKEQRLNKPLNAACPDEMYSLMRSCWSKKPQERPFFSDVVKTISNYTEIIAGYLDINFNPFESSYSPTGSTAATAALTAIPDSPDSEKNVLVSSELLKKLIQEDSKEAKPSNKKPKSPKSTPKVSPKMSPKVSPRPSPSGPSPRISPRASPLLKIRKLKVNQSPTPSGARIEISIESPSEDGSITSSNGLLSVT